MTVPVALVAPVLALVLVLLAPHGRAAELVPAGHGDSGASELTPLAAGEQPPAAAAPAPVAAPAPQPGAPKFPWRALATEPHRGKQDDVFFLTPDLGWYVNGAGRIFKTADGGATWALKLEKPGTYFRCIAFVDAKTGFAGNIGPGYFPGVTDPQPLYRTDDGGETWSAVALGGPPVAGLCALQVLHEPFINAGRLDHRVRILAAGRVGGPAVLLVSDDLGATWTRRELGTAGMALDVHFFDRDHGIVAAATDAAVEKSHALILATSDGGATWRRAYESQRPWETTWKIAFPTREVGWVTIQSYDPDPAASRRYVARTRDGGATWAEVPLVDDHAVREFGVAFADARTGWVGAMQGGFETTDGGATWRRVDMGRAVNEIKLLRDPARPGRLVGYAIGVGLFKLDAHLD